MIRRKLARPGGIRPRARCMGMSAFYGSSDEEGGDRDDPPRPRARHRLPRHRTALRPPDERDTGRARDQGPPRRVRDRHQVRRRLDDAVPGDMRRSGRSTARPSTCAARSRARSATRHRPRRPLLPAPGRPERCRSRRRSARWPSSSRGQGPPHRPERGGAGDDPPRACRSPDHRRADGVLALDPRPRGRGPADLPRARDRLRPLLAARARLSRRARSSRPTSSTRTTSGVAAPVHGREPRGESGARRQGQGDRRGEGRHARAAGDRMGARAGRRPGPDPRHQAAHVPRAERRASTSS